MNDKNEDFFYFVKTGMDFYAVFSEIMFELSHHGQIENRELRRKAMEFYMMLASILHIYEK